jgi:hypothetical protein
MTWVSRTYRDLYQTLGLITRRLPYGRAGRHPIPPMVSVPHAATQASADSQRGHLLLAILLSTSVAAQEPIASAQPPAFPIGSTMMWIVPYADEMYVPPGAAPEVASCYRIGRCSAYDLYRFRDRPNRLARLAPEAPHESVAWPASITYRWVLVPATPEENIVPQYRAASQVRDEYRAVGRPIDRSD